MSLNCRLRNFDQADVDEILKVLATSMSFKHHNIEIDVHFEGLNTKKLAKREELYDHTLA